MNDKEKIEKLEAEIERLKALAFKDELTEILNRRGISDEFNVFFREAKFIKDNPKAKRSIRIEDFSVLFFDIDNFKSINDTYGHDAGDEVLAAVAKIMDKNIRSLDVAGRLGGEEFVVALVGANENEAYKKAEELRALVKEIKVESNPEIKITVSVGAASLRESDADTLERLIELADKAMYEAKTNRGKDNTVRYSEIAKNR